MKLRWELRAAELVQVGCESRVLRPLAFVCALVSAAPSIGAVRNEVSARPEARKALGESGWIRPQAEEASLLNGEPRAAKTDMQSTKEALSLSMGSRLEALRAQGPQGYRNLTALMFDGKEPMQVRWKATTAIGRLGGDLSAPELERAHKRREWFMRSAALVAMQNVDKKRAVEWARALLSDKSLVVRAAAVDALSELRDASSAPMLWRKLWAKENFNGDDSLWIRRRMVEALARVEGPGAETKFMKVLADKDPELHGPAIDGLERISKRRLGEPALPTAAKRELWLKEGKSLRRRG